MRFSLVARRASGIRTPVTLSASPCSSLLRVSTSARATPTRPAPRALFAGLIDDAAVFPPGLRPLPDAVREYQAQRDRPYADLLGPLLVPASAAAQLPELVGQEQGAGPLRVSLIARPGTPVREVQHAVDTLAGAEDVEVVGVELGHQPGWESALELGVPVVVEVSRDPFAQQRAMEELAAAGDHPVRAKFRTQSTSELEVPTPAELATFIVRCARRGTGFKLTGGLHHAVAGTRARAGGGTEEQHGVLNVLLATRAAREGADAGALAGTLADRDAGGLAERVRSLTEEEARDVRAGFTAYGCCGVLDPITELHDLHLIA
jgi:hypothetical protein